MIIVIHSLVQQIVSMCRILVFCIYRSVMNLSVINLNVCLSNSDSKLDLDYLWECESSLVPKTDYLDSFCSSSRVFWWALFGGLSGLSETFYSASYHKNVEIIRLLIDGLGLVNGP